MKAWKEKHALGKDTMAKNVQDEGEDAPKPRDLAVFVPDVQCKLSFFFNGSISSGAGHSVRTRVRFTSRKSTATHIVLTEAPLKGIKQSASNLSEASIAALGQFLGLGSVSLPN